MVRYLEDAPSDVIWWWKVYKNHFVPYHSGATAQRPHHILVTRPSPEGWNRWNMLEPWWTSNLKARPMQSDRHLTLHLLHLVHPCHQWCTRQSHSNQEVRHFISSICSICHEMIWNISCFHNHNHSRNIPHQVTSQHTFRLHLRDIHCLWNHLQLVDLGGHGFWVALVQAAAAAFRKKSRSLPYSRTMPYQYLIHSNIFI